MSAALPEYEISVFETTLQVYQESTVLLNLESYKLKTFQNKLVKLRIIDYKIKKSTTTKLNLIIGSNELKFTSFERKFLFLASPTQLSAAVVSSKCKQSMIQTIESLYIKMHH